MRNQWLYTIALISPVALTACGTAEDGDPGVDTQSASTATTETPCTDCDTAEPTATDCQDFGKSFRVSGEFAWDEASGAMHDTLKGGDQVPPWLGLFFGKESWSGEYTDWDDFCQVVVGLDGAPLTRDGDEYATLRVDGAEQPILLDSCSNANLCAELDPELHLAFARATYTFTWAAEMDPDVEGMLQATFGVGPEYEWGGTMEGSMFSGATPLLGWGTSVGEDFTVDPILQPGIVETDLLSSDPYPTGLYIIDSPVFFEGPQ